MKNIWPLLGQIVAVLAVTALIIGGLIYVANRSSSSPQLLLNKDGQPQSLTGPYAKETINSKQPQDMYDPTDPVAVMTTNKGVIKLELFAKQMPITTGNFIKLANEGFYDGTKFHRVIKGFMIQGGDPNTKTDATSTYGTGGPGYTIQDEFVQGDNLLNVRGTISMANTGQPNSGGSQFFINTVDNHFLDGKHPVFGKVIEGMDVVDTISDVPTSGPGNLPDEPIVVESVKIEQPQG